MTRYLDRLVLVAIAALFAAPIALATPPDHAPAHGRRAQEAAPEKHVATQYDHELGVHVAIGVPGVLYYEGVYYRKANDGRWEVSVTGDEGWSVSAESSIPAIVVRAKSHDPGPAKKAQGK